VKAVLDRLNPINVFRAHWHSLEHRTNQSTRKDLGTRAVLLALPAVVGGLIVMAGHELESAGTFVSALSLFSAGLLAAFAQIANIRAKYPTPDGDYDPDVLTRAMLDEAVALILVAALVSVTTAAAVLVGLNLGATDAQGAAVIPTWLSAPIAAACTYLLLMFIMTIRKLYGAYTKAHDVDTAQHGSRSKAA